MIKLASVHQPESTSNSRQSKACLRLQLDTNQWLIGKAASGCQYEVVDNIRDRFASNSLPLPHKNAVADAKESSLSLWNVILNGAFAIVSLLIVFGFLATFFFGILQEVTTLGDFQFLDWLQSL